MGSYLRENEAQLVRMACAESGMRKEEELALARKAKAGDREAEKKLIQSALNLPRAFAMQRAKKNPEFSESDLYAEGLWGLWAAYRKFNPNRNVRFATYAVNWVKVYMDRYIQRQGANVRTHGNDYGTTYHFVSLNEHLGADEEDGDEYVDRLKDKSPSPEEYVLTSELRSDLTRIIAEEKFSKIERDIIHHRYLHEDKILEELGTMNGVSRERVRQVELQLRRKLQKILTRKGFADE